VAATGSVTSGGSSGRTTWIPLGVSGLESRGDGGYGMCGGEPWPRDLFGADTSLIGMSHGRFVVLRQRPEASCDSHG
jgi:hypothetical protein